MFICECSVVMWTVKPLCSPSSWSSKIKSEFLKEQRVEKYPSSDFLKKELKVLRRPAHFEQPLPLPSLRLWEQHVAHHHVFSKPNHKINISFSSFQTFRVKWEKWVKKQSFEILPSFPLAFCLERWQAPIRRPPHRLSVGGCFPFPRLGLIRPP